MSRCLPILLLAAAAPALAQEYPQPSGYVNDFAGVLSPVVTQSLNQELAAFKKKTTIEIAVVTVDSLRGQSIENYTRGLATEWGVGKRDHNNGVVFLVAPNQRKMRIETASGIRSVLTDARADSIRDSAILPRFRAGDLPGGIVEGTHALMTLLDEMALQPAGRGGSLALFIAFIALGPAALALVLFVIAPPVRRWNARRFVLGDQGAFANELSQTAGRADHPDVKEYTRQGLARLGRDFVSSSIPFLTAAQEKTDWIEAARQLRSFYRRPHRLSRRYRVRSPPRQKPGSKAIEGLLDWASSSQVDSSLSRRTTRFHITRVAPVALSNVSNL